MQSFATLIKNRRSVRKFTDRQLTPEQVEMILRAALMAPTSNHRNPCDVLAVSKEQEMQSLHFGLFLPWVQINSWYSLHQPFYFPEKEKNMYRDYVKLRYSLMPYIYSAALEGAQTGMPIVRSMPMMFPNDRHVDWREIDLR